MGIPRRDGGSGSFQVNIRPLVKTSAEEQGFFNLALPAGTRVLVTGLQLWPNHDRGLHSALNKLRATMRPHIEIVLGNAINEEAFKQVVDSQDRMRKLIAPNQVPELRRIREQHGEDSPEDCFLALAKEAGKFIASFVDAGSGHVFYIPALQASGQLPNEMGLFDFVLGQKLKLDAKADRHPDEAVKGPAIPQDFAEFIGLDDHEHVSVLPFGSALRINEQLRFIGADYKRRQPASASFTDVEHTAESTVRLGDGKVASSWWSTPKHSLGGSHRRWWQSHEVGNLFDLKQLGFLRNYDRRAKGFWYGEVVGENVHGTSMTFLRGADGRRGVVVNGVAFDEDKPTSYARTFGAPAKFKLRSDNKAQDKAADKTAAAPEAKPASKAKARKPAAKGTRKASKRSSARGTSKK